MKPMIVKHRSVGVTSVTATVTPPQVEAEPEENVEQLKFALEQLAKQYQFFSLKKERYEMLMRRPGFKKLSPSKTSRMIRRLVTANKSVEQAADLMDQVAHRLSQHGIEVDIVSRSAA